MPKQKISLSTKMNLIVQKHPKELERDGNKLFCKLCLAEISFDDKHGKHNVDAHLATKGHRNRVENGQQSQSTIVNAFNTSNNVVLNNKFSADLTKMLIEANIPIEKVNDQSFRTFMSKYTKRYV